MLKRKATGDGRARPPTLKLSRYHSPAPQLALPATTAAARAATATPSAPTCQTLSPYSTRPALRCMSLLCATYVHVATRCTPRHKPTITRAAHSAAQPTPARAQTADRPGSFLPACSPCVSGIGSLCPKHRHRPLSRRSALGGAASVDAAHLATRKASMKIWVRWVTMHGMAISPGSPSAAGKKASTWGGGGRGGGGVGGQIAALFVQQNHPGGIVLGGGEQTSSLYT